MAIQECQVTMLIVAVVNIVSCTYYNLVSMCFHLGYITAISNSFPYSVLHLLLASENIRMTQDRMQWANLVD